MKFSLKWLICEPILTYDHEIWVTERIRLLVQVVEIRFLHRVAGLTPHARVMVMTIWESLRLDTLKMTVGVLPWIAQRLQLLRTVNTQVSITEHLKTSVCYARL